jgi:hypothetical protein
LEATTLLLDAMDFPEPIWDCACGQGRVVEVCQGRGMRAFGSDLVDRGFGTGGVDFLATGGGFNGSVICNPPFDRTEEFVHHALRLGAAKVAMIGRLALLEGSGRRERLWTATPFSDVLVFSRRLSMPPGGRGIAAKGGSVAYAWFVFTPGHTGAARVGFLG